MPGTLITDTDREVPSATICSNSAMAHARTLNPVSRPTDADHARGRLYALFFKLVLQHIDAEIAHRIARLVSRAVTRPEIIRRVLRRRLVPRDKEIQVQAFGQTFPSPLGVAAGMDKDVDWYDELALLGFGFVEVGTVTAQPQAGNPRPRIARKTTRHALLNWMGFPNPGAVVAADRLRSRTESVLIGANIGKTKTVPMDRVADDYGASARLLGALADYVVMNISSPNTPGLQAMQRVDLLRPLVTRVREELEAAGTSVPLLIKISPDLDDEELDAICDVALSLEIDGIVAVNTTRNLDGLEGSLEGAKGGLSGRPLKARALEVLQRAYARVGDNLVLISVGGIETPEDAWQRVLAGATLVQAHTGFVYGGPLWPMRMNRGLARRVREAGKTSIQDFIGAGAGDPTVAPTLGEAESCPSEDSVLPVAEVARAARVA